MRSACAEFQVARLVLYPAVGSRLSQSADEEKDAASKNEIRCREACLRGPTLKQLPVIRWD